MIPDDPAIKAAVFDIGNVLVRWDPMPLYRKLVPDETERSALFDRIGFDAMNHRGDRDGSLQAEVEALAKAHPADARRIMAWWERWPEMLGPAIPETAATLQAAKARGLHVAALSNFAADTWEIAQPLFPVLQQFETAVISGHEGHAKPEGRIYEIVEERLGLAGSQIWFIDDRPGNVAAARHRGWQAVLFQG
jgi:2-haloacid dehalogenase